MKKLLKIKSRLIKLLLKKLELMEADPENINGSEIAKYLSIIKEELTKAEPAGIDIMKEIAKKMTQLEK